jgi:asparagine synthase (glutamine-hydrolysing)
VGWIDYTGDPTIGQDVLRAMTQTMACRGPDADGTWSAPGNDAAFMGHRRLAVIDPQGGAQPMVLDTPAGPLVLTYSGETYNWRELRSELNNRGHSFRTECDTEVVLRGYLEWGIDVVDRLVGMYAFALWDGRSDRLVLVRDRLGIKPLVYHRTPNGVVFASEPKALFAHPQVTPRVGTLGLHELFNFVKTPGRTIWDNVQEVRPGTVVTVDREGLRERVYWSLSTSEHRDERPATVARVRELLTASVTEQLEADVPLAVLLSGGLDSSALTALAAGGPAAGTSGPVRTFSVDFTDHADTFTADELRGTLDAPYVRKVAEHVGSTHADIVLDSAFLADPRVREAVVRARDCPAGVGDLDASLLELFRAVRREATVVLSGEGADEIFGGYRWFHLPEVQRADNFPWIAMSSPSSPFSHPAGLFTPDLNRALDLPGYTAGNYADALTEVEHLPGDNEHTRRMRVLCYLHLTRHMQQLLDRKDRISMAVGLEVRVPYCDHRLLEYVYNVPWELKASQGQEKSLLRDAVRDLLPETVVDRTKSQYPTSQDPRYAAALLRQAGELLADGQSPLFDLVDRGWLREATAQSPEQVQGPVRRGLERVLDLATWLRVYRPEIRLS